MVFEDYGTEAALDNASAASAPERSQDNHFWHSDDEGDFYSVVTAYKSRNPDGETLLWDATHSHPADSGIQPALQSDHHEASDDGKSAEQKEDTGNIMFSSEKSIGRGYEGGPSSSRTTPSRQ